MFKYQLNDDWERGIVQLYFLCVSRSSLEGIKVDSLVVDRYCEKYELDFIDTLEDIKQIAYGVVELKEDE